MRGIVLAGMAASPTGVYHCTHPLSDAVAYEKGFEEIENDMKAMTRKDGALLAATDWTVNGSAVEGRAIVPRLLEVDVSG